MIYGIEVGFKFGSMTKGKYRIDSTQYIVIPEYTREIIELFWSKGNPPTMDINRKRRKE